MKRHHKTDLNKWSESLIEVHKMQPKIADAFSGKINKYGPSHPKQIELTDSIIQDLIIDLGLPLSLVERPAFIRFMKKADPKYAVTSRRTITRQMIPDLYDKMRKGLQEFCNTAQFISLTLDIWTDRRMRSFFAVTGHAIINGDFKSYVLSFLPMQGIHTGDALFAEFENVVSTYSIRDKLVRIVTDNASNNIKAFEQLFVPGFEVYFEPDEDGVDHLSEGDEEAVKSNKDADAAGLSTIEKSFDTATSDAGGLRIPCFPHTLELVVRDDLNNSNCAKYSLSKVAKIAKLSHNSTKFSEQLEKLSITIPTAVPTRWNSQYDCVCKILEIANDSRNNLNQMLTDINKTDLRLLPRDYAILNEFVSLFALFAEATIKTQADKSPSISLVAPSLLGIYLDLQHELQNNCNHTTSLCKTLLTSLKSRFGGLLEKLYINIDESILRRSTYHLYSDNIFLISPLLDAKFKLNWTINSSLPE
ncbi:unnamed protein product [Didymodactylos carnosus]|uniref:Uncharacterized protein n=2 Tax=Didymodactylos carnosus TaxID=1234261 RepID=A0A815YUF1_9BILA|nr:unnamed protein product [Didymodactylos carnosus]CAF4439797.1 unnamed protein product [Didymodactylos carnosus]